MSDPDRINDTEPMGCPAASEEGPDADADEATEPNDASRGDVAAASSEHDTDDFLRWLPTLALGHRRRAELVERASSDGADFAAYAYEGRPAAASGQPRLEPAVNVQTPPHVDRSLAARDAEREAPTILTRERGTRRPWRRIGWAALGVAAAAGLAAWAERPWAEKVSRRGEAVATAPLPIGRAPTPPVEVTVSAAAPAALPLQASPTDGARTPPDRRAVPSSAAAADAARKQHSAGAPRTVASSARRGAVPPAAAVPSKDQYFEAP
jgi:hypothetical protein